jgi:hypothetical protein
MIKIKKRKDSHGNTMPHPDYSVSQTPPYLPAPSYLEYEPPQKERNPSLENRNPSVRMHAGM